MKISVAAQPEVGQQNSHK